MDPESIKRREYYHKRYSDPEKRKRVRELANAKYKHHPRQPKKPEEYSQTYFAKKSREYYANGKHHDSNANRSSKMATAHSLIQYHQIPMSKFCELCPEDDQRLAEMRHHMDYDYPLIFVSVCRACHTAVHRALKKQQLVEAVIS
jgi:hypothetical protein